MNENLLTMILTGVAIVLLIVLVVVAIEIIRTMRKVQGVLDDLVPSVNETIAKVNTSIDTLEPSLKRADPLLERVSLTIDAVNLEIMRADQILADVSDVTSVASGTARKVSNITETPLNLLTSATDRIRNVFVDKKAQQRTERALKNAEAATEAIGAGEARRPAHAAEAPVEPLAESLTEPVLEPATATATADSAFDQTPESPSMAASGFAPTSEFAPAAATLPLPVPTPEPTPEPEPELDLDEPVEPSWPAPEQTATDASLPQSAQPLRSDVPPPNSAASSPPPSFGDSRVVPSRKRTATTHATESSTIFFD
jgi:uncharacterized protein YoxC